MKELSSIPLKKAIMPNFFRIFVPNSSTKVLKVQQKYTDENTNN